MNALEIAQTTLERWRQLAQHAPLRGPGSAPRQRVRELEVLTSIASKRAAEADRAATDLLTFITEKGADHV